MLNDIKAVIFDLDGTLVDSMGIWKQIDIDYLALFGYELPDELQSEIEGMSFTETAEYFKRRFHIKDSVEEIKAWWNDKAYEMYANQVPLKEGAHEFLDECVANGIKLGIATSNSEHLAKAVLKKHQILSMFDCVLTACDVNIGKPAPDVYLECAKRLSVQPSNCLVFEDITPGIMAGKNAGMRVCAVEDTYSMHQNEEKRELADYFISDYFEIMDKGSV